MEFLKPTQLGLIVALCSPVAGLGLFTSACAEVPSLFSGVEGSTNGSVGAGSVYSLGGSLTLRMGSDEDDSSHTGDFHFNYSDQIAPSDPSSATSDLKHSDNWAGGAAVSPFEDALIGVDLDKTIDKTEGLYSDGVKATLGYEPFKLSYRYARTYLQSPFQIPISRRGFLNFQGASIYQQTLELEGTIDPGENDSISLTPAYSWYNPDAVAFSSLLSQNFLTSISHFSDTLQSFETWALATEWKHKWSADWDTTASARLSHLIVTANSLIATTLAMGHDFNDSIHAQIGWDYSHDPSNHQTLATFELRFSLGREKENTLHQKTKSVVNEGPLGNQPTSGDPDDTEDDKE